ncbi:hypothetical protein EX895_003593 [Sporisorium graminicola]|uniref:Uncharacterized protein n=1 Tax=Sporisorium graminicola TaxID=280036 RepID=A0A4V6EU12_9BASI|nr:hypothetical protein EX895_003593 [Sporisorium graminicola]TKY87579.1 hypothetical protein EX895_003593 [Sporisorium graminicola]
MRSLARGFTSSAKTLSESTSSAAAAPASASAPRPPRSNKPSQRLSQSGDRASERLRAGQRNRSSQQTGQNGNKTAGNDRRNKRLPSVFDAASASARSRPNGGARVKSLTHGSQSKVPAPLPTTDWNSPLFSKPGFERMLASAPRASSVFVPDLAAAASSAPAASGKGKGKAAAAPTKVAGAKLNLPGIKTAVNALKLHIRPGGRNILGPVNNPTAVASGVLSHNRVAISSRAAASDNKSLAEELKAARIALQNEQIGGSYERFGSQAVVKAAGVQAKDSSPPAKAVRDAAQALALNADLALEAKGYVAKTIAERLSA